jgi:hypothetical protein
MMAFVAALQGFFFARNRWWETALLLLICFTLFRPNFWMDRIVPPYRELPAAEVMRVVEETKGGGALRVRVATVDMSGEDTVKTIRLTIGAKGDARERLSQSGLVLSPGPSPTLVSVRPGSEAARQKLRPGDKIEAVNVLNERPSPFLFAIPALLTLVIMGLLDTLGTLVGLGAAAGLLDEKGRFPDIARPMAVDAVSSVFAGLVGTTTSGAYIESATGIREGARTGLAAVTTAALFAVSLFFVPLVEPLQRLRYAYAPALVAVGLLMASSVRRIDFDDLTELVPAFATIVMMVFTYNIGNGLTAGLVLYPVVKVAAGRAREVKGGAWALAAISAVYFVFGLPH